MDKYLSIITNFGCHYTCPYCIVKKNGIKVPQTTIEGLDKLPTAIDLLGANIISLSGGGDPAHDYFTNPYTIEWYDRLYRICHAKLVKLEMHTSYPEWNAWYDYYDYHRVVYHLRDIKSIERINMNCRAYNEDHLPIIRVVFVVTNDMTEDTIKQISDVVKASPFISELSFRQRVDENYKVSYHLHDFLKAGHKKDWWYIEQDDYNLYYVENRIYTKYSEIG